MDTGIAVVVGTAAVIIAVVVPFEVVGPCCTTVETGWGIAHMAMGAAVSTDAVAVDTARAGLLESTRRGLCSRNSAVIFHSLWDDSFVIRWFQNYRWVS